MRIALVSMPWASFVMPSAALGALSAYVHREEPDLDIACRSEYLELAGRMGIDLYEALCKQWRIGEMLYLALFYPQRAGMVQSWFIERAPVDMGDDPKLFVPGIQTWPEMFSFIQDTLRNHLETLAEQIAQTTDVLGLTTSMSQNFASLALAHRVKELNPDVFVVLGGSGTRRPAGMSLLKEYAFVDAIVEGEGERPLLDLLRGLSERTIPDKNIPGVVTRVSELPIITWEMPGLDDLPFPDFGEYLSLADRYNILWLIPIEGSRGCWWDQSVRTGDPARR